MKSNIWKFYIACFCSSLFFGWPVYILFLNEKVGITLSQIYLAESIYSYIGLPFTLIGGSLADLWGRRKVLIISCAGSVVAATILALVSDYWHLLLWAIIGGVSLYVSSGAGSALIFDSLKFFNQTDKFKKVAGLWMFFYYLGRGVASFTGGWLYSISPRLPLYLSIIPAFIATITVFLMKEAPYRRNVKKNILKQVKLGFSLIEKSFSLKYFVIYISLFIGLANIFFKLYQPYMKLVNFKILYFGVIYGVLNFISAASSFLFEKFSKKLSPYNIQHFMMLGAGFSGIAMALILAKESVIWIFLISFIFGIQDPLMNYFINSKVKESDKRATVLAIVSLAGSFAYATGLFLLARLSAFLELPQTLLYIGLVMILLTFVFRRYQSKLK